MMKTTRRTLLTHAMAIAILATINTGASAAAYPDKPVRFLVPYPPGAATDTLGRLAAQTYADALGQPFVVENRGGGGTTIGTRAVASAEPDGYTLGIVDSTFTINPGLLGDRLPYDTARDFTPITLMATAPFVMVVHPSVKATTVAEFIALAKAQPGTLSYGSAGVGSAPHLAGEQLRQQAGVEILHIPYRGGSTVFTDLLGGQVQFAFATVPTLAEHIKAGKVRALAVTGPSRAAQLPDVPTFNEAGIAGVDIAPIFGVVGPAGLAPDLVQQLASTLDQAIKQGNLRDKLVALGFEPVGSGPTAFRERITTDIAKWRQVIQQSGIKPE